MNTHRLKDWTTTGAPYIWLTAGAVTLSIVMVLGLLLLIAARGLSHFWPHAIEKWTVAQGDGVEERLIGEVHDVETIPFERVATQPGLSRITADTVDRYLLKVGNRDLFGADFRPVLEPLILSRRRPIELMAVERTEYGNLYGYLRVVKRSGETVATGSDSWPELQVAIDRALRLKQSIADIEQDELNAVNSILQERLAELNEDLARDTYVTEVQSGDEVEQPVSKIVRAYRPNAMSNADKLKFYAIKLWEFLSEAPRESNTEGGVYPAIFGTVMMVLLMSVIVAPFGVVAAVYLHEYARQGPLTRLIRISVNNLAGVPSIVYGVFGLGFFVYFVGGNIDRAFFAESLPSPTFGTGGILWASLTLALLTLPVVIVSTEEGLARIPRTIREGSLALGATQAETLWRTVLPMASPAMMTGLILAVARAAGEVAPLMLVGVVKLAPSLPVSTEFPFIHLEHKFMHLGFHIYDVGFQSPNVEAARPLVYATALLLVAVILGLNLLAIYARNRLRERYRALET